jgi:murein DD-endopeptidase MepM/ murein hydrolase activator NlpD
MFAAALAVGAQAGLRSGSTQPSPRALEYGIQIQIPGQTPILAGEHVSPPWEPSSNGAFGYPADGSIVRVATLTGRMSTTGGGASVRAGADLTKLSLFGGEITADSVVARATATLAGSAGAADFGRSSVTNLDVLGQAVTPTPGLRVTLADWGHAILLEQEQRPGKSIRTPTYHAWVTVLDVWLDATHAGLPAGTRILIGYADALASAAPPSTPPPGAPAVPSTQPASPAASAAPTPSSILNDLGLFPVLTLPPPLQSSITSQGYVFPVFGASGYGDTFGAPRSDVSGGWHHGDDIFAPLGAPILAIADGTVFSVGHEKIGGNRLWLQDKAGNQFYFAHLSAYTPLARNGTQVHAGDVLGFVGNTGDAAGGAYHLHFEVHPASLLFLGYDGAVDPTPYLDAWRHLRDVHFPAGVAWAPQPLHSLLPPPGAMLLQSTDISTASGLDPGSLEQALRPHAGEALLSGGR